MLLMVEKDIRRGICHAIHRYTKANNKYMKEYDENKESSYLKYFDIDISIYLCGWTVSKNLPVNNFKWVKDISKFDESFIKVIMKKVIKDIFLKLMFNILQNYITFTMI